MLNCFYETNRRIQTMAQSVMMTHPVTGLRKMGFTGFSWTTFFFGMWPALFRGDFVAFLLSFLILCIIALVTAGFGAWIAMFIWAFLYNKNYTQRLLEKGYVLDDTEEKMAAARTKLDMMIPATSAG